jgi:YbgC/YbaW family acyl-CoA thioester hydrolase
MPYLGIRVATRSWNWSSLKNMENNAQIKRYQTLVKPRLSDFDFQGILNSQQYMNILGEARIEQMETFYGKPIEKYAALGQSFVLTNFEIQYMRPIYLGSKFLVETQVVKIDGPKSFVEYAFLSADAKKTHAKGTVAYVLIDLKTKQPLPHSEEDISIFL